jgi:hypothetical protein
MNNSKRIPIIFLVIVLVLVACGTQPTANASPTINLTYVNSTAQSAAVTLLAQTMTVFPTSTVVPTNTPTSVSPTSTLTPLPFMVLDGLRVAYMIDNNLYVQDSGKQAIQLTHSNQDHRSTFSDDGQKIVFFREWATKMNQLRVIDADGTGEQVLITSELLNSLDLGYNDFTELHFVAFVPGTHLLLFNTHNYSTHYPKNKVSHPQPNNDLLLVDTDTSEVKQLLPIKQGGFFLVSPNGKHIAVQTSDHVDVIDFQGRIILRNLASHSTDYDCVFYGYMCTPMYWTQDSSELILVQPIPLSEYPTNRVNPLIRTVWRYPMNGKPGIEIRLTLAPMGEALSVSPDGNRIVYSLFEIGSQDGVYLGNLRDGTSQLIYQPELNKITGVRDPAPISVGGWSPDSAYFLFSDIRNRLFMGNIQGEITPLGGMNIFGWVDNRHYFGNNILSEVGNQEAVRVMEFPPGIDPSESPPAFVFLGH